MSGIHRERPRAEAIAPSTGAPALDLGGGIWMSPGLSNSYLLQTDEGRILINTGMGFEGPLHRRAYDAVDSSRARTIVFTQGHYDHVGGTDSLRDEDTELVAQANFSMWRADNERLEAFRSRNAAFAWMRAILAALEHGQSSGAGSTAQARPEPTTLFDDRLELVIGGRKLVLLSTPGGETTDSLVVWLPESRTAFTGNLFGPLFGHVPNLVTIRGDRYRDALSYIESLDRILELSPERLITGHFDPIEGSDRIASEVTAMRDATQWVHDRTVDGMNAGTDVHTLMGQVSTPDHLDVGEGYGKTSWNVRAIWENYAGWFHHRSTTELYDVPPAAVSPDLVATAGADALVSAARARLEAAEPVAALHLTDIVLAVDPNHPDARAVAADASRSLLDSSANFWERAWLDPVGRTTGEPAMNEVSFDFSDASVVVTGGTSGIGHAIAAAFATAGATVTISGTRSGPEHYDTDLRRFSYRQAELADPDSVDALIDTLGVVDVLVNNAGANFPGGRDEWEPDTFAAALSLNLIGPMRLTMGCRDRLAASTLAGGASVVNMASMAAFRSVPIVPGYGSAKAGLVTLTHNLARQWVADGIRVNAVAPGVVDTPMTAPLAQLPELLESELAHTPMGRLGAPGEIAGAVQFLASSAASYITGHVLVADGGYLLP